MKVGFFFVPIIILYNVSELRTFLNIGQNTILKAMLYFNKKYKTGKNASLRFNGALINGGFKTLLF